MVIFEFTNRIFEFFFFFTDLNVPLFLALMIEKSIAGKWISWTIAKILHFVNLGSVLLLPVYVINVKYEHIGPGKISSFIFSNIFLILVYFIFLKPILFFIFIHFSYFELFSEFEPFFDFKQLSDFHPFFLNYVVNFSNFDPFSDFGPFFQFWTHIPIVMKKNKMFQKIDPKIVCDSKLIQKYLYFKS